MPDSKKAILVTGCRGQLGSEIQAVADMFRTFDFTFIDVNDLDITNGEDVSRFFGANRFDAVVNCAAYTAVDLAEDQRDLAFLVNAEAVRIIAQHCRERGIRLVHISTDYVFDGESNEPLKEEATPNPVSVYGQSKLDGEKHVLSLLPDAYIIRTAWVYSTYGKNFVKTISTLAQQRPELTVVADQIGTPTYAHDLARAILEILDAVFQKKKDVPGIYHYTNEGAISWYDFAHFIVRYLNVPCIVTPVRSSEYKTKAARPKFSLLSKQKIRSTFGIRPPHWHDSLIRCLDKMSREG